MKPVLNNRVEAGFTASADGSKAAIRGLARFPAWQILAAKRIGAQVDLRRSFAQQRHAANLKTCVSTKSTRCERVDQWLGAGHGVSGDLVAVDLNRFGQGVFGEVAISWPACDFV